MMLFLLPLLASSKYVRAAANLICLLLLLEGGHQLWLQLHDAFVGPEQRQAASAVSGDSESTGDSGGGEAANAETPAAPDSDTANAVSSLSSPEPDEVKDDTPNQPAAGGAAGGVSFPAAG